MPHAKTRPRPTRRRLAAFALLVVITLLAFLVILLVGLATVTRVETSIAGNTQRQAQAREHALLALNLAVAQLQRQAGPDQRVTATAEAFSTANKRYTGVWDATTTDATPLTWLVSGNEVFQANGTNNPLARKPTGALTTTGANPTGVELVGKNSSGTANDVVAPLVPITAAGVPGTATTATPIVGRYAWWVGDQGVKAPVALRDATATASNYPYAPFSSDELRSRIRQQVALGAGAATTAGAAVFEPRDTTGTPSNATLAANTTAAQQIAFLRTSTGTVGAPALQQNFHAWSPNNFGVLANAKAGGLRQDLSLKPTLLGADFAAWANPSSYMEDPTSPAAIAPVPPYASDPVRRRYTMQSGPPTISPVLSFFLLSFNVRTLPTAGGNQSGSRQRVQVRLRGTFTFWNPYSSALVPENLRLEISGLPPTVFLNDLTVPGSSTTVPFGSLFGSGDKVSFSLPWSTAATGDTRQSWLPGRTYSWTILEDISGNPPPVDGYACQFNSQDISSVSGQGVQQTTSIVVDGSDACSIDFGSTSQLTIRLIAERGGNDVVLGTFASPVFQPFSAMKTSVGAFTYTPTFFFRLAESDNGLGAWLTTAGIDPRETPLSGQAYVSGANGPLPDQYPGLFKVSAPERLLDRDVSSFSYNEDVPVFELPRAPLLSLGSLQHVHVAGARPFAYGNSWGGALNRAFDQYFFSGLTPDTDWSDVTKPLPNPLLQVTRHKPDATAVTPDDVKDADGYSGKFLLQGGAFNLNSVNRAAWVAVLRSVRFPTATNFRYHDVSAASGTGDDSTTTLSDPLLARSQVAAFPRFGQSAQETFKADDGYVQSDSSGSSNNVVNTPLFRRGIRFLSEQDVSNLADKIVTLIAARLSASDPPNGPFRSLEEFLSPSPALIGSAGAPVSLLEKAIEDAGLNTDAALGLTDTSAEFSSQWLTQADIMTALAPVLFARSDTFVVRAYGEAVNPITNATEGRAWCEATVQRVPEYFNAAADDAATAPAALTDSSNLNQTLGRRFKVVSFRWLTRSDI